MKWAERIVRRPFWPLNFLGKNYLSGWPPHSEFIQSTWPSCWVLVEIFVGFPPSYYFVLLVQCRSKFSTPFCRVGNTSLARLQSPIQTSLGPAARARCVLQKVNYDTHKVFKELLSQLKVRLLPPFRAVFRQVRWVWSMFQSIIPQAAHSRCEITVTFFFEN